MEGEFAEKSLDTWIRGLRGREPGRSHGTLDPWGSNLVPQWRKLSLREEFVTSHTGQHWEEMGSLVSHSLWRGTLDGTQALVLPHLPVLHSSASGHMS